MSDLPIISLWQPYASLIFAGRKAHETRSFRFTSRLIGQRIGIHATAKFPPLKTISEALHELCMDEFGCSYNYTLPQGAILGTVQLISCEPTGTLLAVPIDGDDLAAGDWSHGRFVWKLDAPRALPSPIPAKGKQGWWKVPSELLGGHNG